MLRYVLTQRFFSTLQANFLHSQITSEGHVLTWGKGRYGRLGHADSEDQLKPKIVEMLLGYKAVDIACGSGDAQTLCITDDGKFC